MNTDIKKFSSEIQEELYYIIEEDFEVETSLSKEAEEWLRENNSDAYNNYMTWIYHNIK